MIAGDPPVQRGKNAEQLALDYLNQFGLTLLQRNFRCRLGEIDLIMQEGTTTVFVEVRSRTSDRVMDTIETINRKKVQKIIRTAGYYLQQTPEGFGPYRFDIITLTGKIDSPRIDWIKNAFADE